MKPVWRETARPNNTRRQLWPESPQAITNTMVACIRDAESNTQINTLSLSLSPVYTELHVRKTHRGAVPLLRRTRYSVRTVCCQARRLGARRCILHHCIYINYNT